MLVLGFTNHYYTQWNVMRNTGADEYGRKYEVADHYYEKNLSMNYDEAVKKIDANSGGSFEIDLSLRGESYFATKRMITDFSITQFTFGMLTGKTFDECTVDDAWQLQRAMNSEPNPRRRVLARAKLIELGELIKYTWTEHYTIERNMTAAEMMDTESYKCGTESQREYMLSEIGLKGSWIKENRTRVRKYCPKKLHAAIIAANEVNQYKGHWHANGGRLELKLKKIGKAKYFDGAFGTTILQNYISPDNKVYKYMGTSEPDIADDKFTLCTATVKHEMYRDQKETKLSRIKIANK